MTAQTDRLHAGVARPTQTAPTTEDLRVTLDAARAAVRAAPSPETIAAHYAAYAALYARPWHVELWPVLLTLALCVGVLALFCFVGGWGWAVGVAGGGAALLGLLYMVRRVAAD